MSLDINLPAPESPPVASLDVSVVLDGSTYTLRIFWNSTDAGWRVRVYDEPGQNVLAGDERLSVDWPRYVTRVGRQPPGFLTLMDTSGRDEDATLEGLGDRWKLCYTTQAELLERGIAA